MVTRRKFLKDTGALTGIYLASKPGPGSHDTAKVNTKKAALNNTPQDINQTDYDSENLEEFAELINPENIEVQLLAMETGIAKFGSLTVNYPEEVDFQPASDKNVFGEKDYWATPSEYMDKNFRGDCDDYSIFNTSLLQAKDIEARSAFDMRTGKEHVLTEFKYDEDYWITDVRDPGEVYLREKFDQRVNWEPEKMTDGEVVEDYDWEW